MKKTNLFLLMFMLALTSCAGTSSVSEKKSNEISSETSEVQKETSQQEESGKGKHVFEAEDTYVADIIGGNFSSNPTGKSLIYKDTKNLNASNGYFVGSLSNPDATVIFEIKSEKKVSDVKFSAFVSSNTYNFTLSSSHDSEQHYEIAVNGEELDYQPFSVKANQKFMEVILPSISLQEGDNEITFATKNSYSPTSGIFAAAPSIDCIVLEKEGSILTQTKYEGNY